MTPVAWAIVAYALLILVGGPVLGHYWARAIARERARQKAASDAAWLANVHEWNRKDTP